MQQIEKKQILCQQIDIKLNVLDATKWNKNKRFRCDKMK